MSPMNAHNMLKINAKPAGKILATASHANPDSYSMLSAQNALPLNPEISPALEENVLNAENTIMWAHHPTFTAIHAHSTAKNAISKEISLSVMNAKAILMGLLDIQNLRAAVVDMD